MNANRRQSMIRILRCSGLIGALVLVALLLSRIRPSPRADQRTSAPPLFSAPAPRTRAANDVGRFLAGLPGDDGSPFKRLESQEAWRVHRRELDQAWGAVEGEWVPALHDFQTKELSGALIENSIVFYPFSGPDALVITTFFPHARTVVMVGLEPAGTLPTPKQIAKTNLDTYLAEVRDTVSSELHRSFFITREMDREFRGQVTDGLLPPILLLLVRTHHTVLGYRYVRLDDQGRVIERAVKYKAPGIIGNKGLEIDFRTEADQSFHKLFYFSINLSDERLLQDKPFLTFLSNLKGMTTFLKATSYMTHRKEFSIIREQVLADSASILQDDSGIPYRLFDAARWRVQLYGDYERPFGSFRWFEQEDLRRAYDRSGIRPLGFHIGYGFSRIPSNLMLAERIGLAAMK